MYLSDPARAAKVAKYISEDGAGCASITVPCIAPAQATNTRPGQTHRRNLEFARDLLERGGFRPIGYLLIGVPHGATGSYYSYGVATTRTASSLRGVP